VVVPGVGGPGRRGRGTERLRLADLRWRQELGGNAVPPLVMAAGRWLPAPGWPGRAPAGPRPLLGPTGRRHSRPSRPESGQVIERQLESAARFRPAGAIQLRQLDLPQRHCPASSAARACGPSQAVVRIPAPTGAWRIPPPSAAAAQGRGAAGSRAASVLLAPGRAVASPQRLRSLATTKSPLAATRLEQRADPGSGKAVPAIG